VKVTEYNKPELVVPAGDWSSLSAAIEHGADSVYFGVKAWSMRQRADNFDPLEIKKVMGLLHENGRRGYLALNIIVFNKEIDRVKKVLLHARKAGVDAVILWDMSVLTMAREAGLRIHLSTQASVSNIEAIRYYASIGVKRIVLARECSLEDTRTMIKQIKKEKINCGIEVFIHGAMCVSISGRCFLSQHSFSKSANRGECLQPCRREFDIIDTDGDSRYVLGRDYVLSSKDLCTVDILDRLITAGIHAFKIEGRIRSSEYVKMATLVYRKAIDSFFEGKLDDELKLDLKKRLKTVYNRGASTGFYEGKPEDWISRELGSEYERVYLGEVVKYYKKIGVAEVFVRNEGLRKGQEIVIMGKTTPARITKIDELQKDHKPVDFGTKGEPVGVKLPFSVKPKDKVFIRRFRDPDKKEDI